jgi:hypothetical protein
MAEKYMTLPAEAVIRLMVGNESFLGTCEVLTRGECGHASSINERTYCGICKLARQDGQKFIEDISALVTQRMGQFPIPSVAHESEGSLWGVRTDSSQEKWKLDFDGRKRGSIALTYQVFNR